MPQFATLKQARDNYTLFTVINHNNLVDVIPDTGIIIPCARFFLLVGT